MQDFEGIIQRMIAATGARNTVDLAEMIGISQSAVSTWRKRKKIPASAIAKVIKLTNVSYQWLEIGKEEPPKQTPEQQISLPKEMVQQVNEQISAYGENALSESAIALGKIFDQLKPEQQVIMLTQASVMLLANGQESE